MLMVRELVLQIGYSDNTKKSLFAGANIILKLKI